MSYVSYANLGQAEAAAGGGGGFVASILAADKEKGPQPDKKIRSAFDAPSAQRAASQPEAVAAQIARSQLLPGLISAPTGFRQQTSPDSQLVNNLLMLAGVLVVGGVVISLVRRS